VAFRRKAWETVGGYPEWLDTAEDTLFDLKLKKAKMKFTLARNAIVYWKVRKNVKEIFKQFYNYAKGEGFALLFPVHYLARYVAAIIFFLLAIVLWLNVPFWLLTALATLLGFWIKHLRRLKRPSLKDCLVASSVALAIEAGSSLGYLKGMSSRIGKLSF
jgi:cellulose synthase/poly-beta-1,6-N-acetylglucosamine synthase-like glycosyltransferase